MRPITITTAQFGDMSFEDMCRTIGGLGYDGVEIACASHLDAHKYVADSSYRDHVTETLEKNHLKVWALSGHLAGQCVGDNWDPRLDNFAPAKYSGKPEEIRKWAIEESKTIAEAAGMMGVRVITNFMGSPIWPYWYSFPQTSQQMVDEGYEKIRELWSPILDVYDENEVKFALEVHPTEIAFDYYSTRKLLDTFEYRETMGINFDPSHLQWQGMDPALFLRDFADRVYHVHIKDVKVRLDGRAGILGSHIEFGDVRRGWNFVTPGHGDVDFDQIIRELNQIGYEGPLSVEWEDSGMDRMTGVTEALSFARKINFSKSDIAFDAGISTKG